MADSSLAYPIGPWVAPAQSDASSRAQLVSDLAGLPAAVRDAVSGLSDAELDTPYRPEGWTIRQVVHHLPDSHLNAYVRFRLALTEDTPVIRPYDEQAWALLPDATHAPIAVSLDLLAALHARWVEAIRRLPAAAFARTFTHPVLGAMSLDHQLALYAWHGRHHLAHITRLIDRMGWRPRG